MYYKIDENKKGLVAKIQVFTKDFKTGKGKLVTKRIYNVDNLSKSKFEKYVEKLALQYEEDIQNIYKSHINGGRVKVLTFEELSKEFLDNIRANLSANYYVRAKYVIRKFNEYLAETGLNKEPISNIRVRDIQLHLNSFQTYNPLGNANIRLKKDLPKKYSWRLLARAGVIDRCASYALKKEKKKITKEKALQICKFYRLEFNEYFEEVNLSQQYAAETVRGHRRILRAVFNEAVRYEWINKNPVCQTKIGAGSNNLSLRPIQEKEVFSFHEAKEFLSALDAIDDDLIFKRVIFKFMLLTGVRLAEMSGLRWSDIDFTRKVVKIQRSRLYLPEFGVYEKAPKTKTSIREIPINDYLIADLRKYQKWFRLADRNFDDNLDKYYLASGIYRTPASRHAISTWLKDIEVKNGFKKVSCHGLRHTYCSLLLSQNVPIQTVSKYMGHSESTITLKVYSHFIPDTQEKVVNALDNLV